MLSPFVSFYLEYIRCLKRIHSGIMSDVSTLAVSRAGPNLSRRSPSDEFPKSVTTKSWKQTEDRKTAL